MGSDRAVEARSQVLRQMCWAIGTGGLGCNAKVLDRLDDAIVRLREVLDEST